MANEALRNESRLSSLLGRHGLDGKAVALLEEYGIPESFRTGKVLFWQGDRAEAAYLILAGSVVPVKYGNDSESFELPPRKPSSWAGLAETISESSYGFDATAPEGCEVLKYTEFNLEQVISNGKAASYLLNELAREECRLLKALENSGALDRIVDYLLRKRKVIAGLSSPRLELTQAELANAIGLSRETVNKRLKAMERSGLLKTGRGSIEVPDWDALSEFKSG